MTLHEELILTAMTVYDRELQIEALCDVIKDDRLVNSGELRAGEELAHVP